MTDLPPIPDDIQRLAVHAGNAPGMFNNGMAGLSAVVACWPFLYATALRHAATELSADRYRQRTGAVVGVLLRRMADDADPLVEVEGSVVDPYPTRE